MLRSTAAVQALQDGCSRLGLPGNTATELVKFLSVKRVHDTFVDSSRKQLRMSPGAAVDKLWHFMLLNTAVSTQVYELLGGVVEHRGIDDRDLWADTKLLQRLYSLNVMRLEGVEPDVTLWAEPGTSMHTVLLSTGPVPQLQDLPGGGLLYVTAGPTFTEQLQGQLVQALVALFAPSCCGTVQQWHRPSGSATPQQDDWATAQQDDALLQEQAEAGMQDAVQAGGFHIFVKTLTGHTMQLTVGPWMTVQQVKMLYADLNGLEIDAHKSYRFVSNGRQLLDDATLAEVGVHADSQITAILRLGGC